MTSTPVTVKRPVDCDATEIEAFVDLVVSGGEVDADGLPGRVRRAKFLAFLREGERLIGVAGLKLPSKNHRGEVAAAAGHELPGTRFAYELGWVFVDPASRGGKSLLLCGALVEAAAGQGIFATSRVDNPWIHATLKKLGFRQEGSDFPSQQNPGTRLWLFTTPASTVTSPSA